MSIFTHLKEKKVEVIILTLQNLKVLKNKQNIPSVDIVNLRPFLKLFFKLKDNCFTEFCCFLPNINMNQPQVYIYVPSLLNHPPISLPIPPLQVDTEPLFEFPETYSKFPLAIYFTHGNISFHVTLSKHLTLSSLLPVSISQFSVSLLLSCK